MALTASEVATLGFTTLDHYVRNRPKEQIAYAMPWLKKLRSMKKNVPAAKEFIVEQVKTGYGSNMQAVKGDTTVTYNKRDNVRQANYGWTGYHVGFQINEDMCAAQGVTLTDDEGKKGSSSRAEVEALTNLLDDHAKDMLAGFDEELDQKLLLDGTASADDIVGLDAIVSRTAGATVGGINSATSAYWDNLRSSGLTAADIVEAMEQAHRNILRYKGKPNFIMAGGKAIDLFRAAAKAEISRYSVLKTSGESPVLDPSLTDLHFKGIPILYNPQFEALDDLLSPASADEWSKRFYMLSCSDLKFRPIKGHDGIARVPARESSNYIHKFAHTWKGALTCSKRNSHWVGTIS